MLILLLPFILLLFAKKFTAKGSVGRLLVYMYLVSALVSVLKYFLDYPKEGVNEFAVAYYIACTLLFLYPFISLGNHSAEHFELDDALIKKISIIVGLFGIIEIAYTIPQLFTIQTLVNNLSEVRQNYYNNLGLEVDSPYAGDLLYTLTMWVHEIQFLTPFCCIYFFSLNRKFFSIFLFIASLSFPLSKMLIGEREAALVFVSNYIFCIVFFKNRIDPKRLKNIVKYLIVSLLPIVAYIVGMTFSRFSESDEGLLGGLFIYGGEQPFNFSYFFTSLNINEQNLGGRLCFGYLFPQNEQLVEQLNYYISSNKYLNVFAGAPGSFFFDFGYYAVFVIMLISLFFTVLLHPRRVHKGHMPMSVFFVFYLLYQVEFMDIFYYDFKSKYQVIMALLVYMSLLAYERLFYKRKSRSKLRNPVSTPA